MPKKKNLNLYFFINYNYVDRHILKAGLEVLLLNNEKAENKLFLGAGYGLVNYNSKIFGLPDLHLSYYFSKALFTKIGTSINHLYTLAGITYFNYLDLEFGYSHSYDKNKAPNIQGFTIGINVRLSKNNKAFRNIDWK